MLRLRIITAVILVPPLIAALFLLPSTGIAILFGAFIAAGAWEWAGLSALTFARRLAYVGLVLALGAAIIVASRAYPSLIHLVFALAALWWIVAIFQLPRRAGGLLHSRAGRLAAGVLTLVPAWLALSVLHYVDPQQPFLLLFVLLLVAIADTAAYAAGHAFGRTKLAPSVSPGKTIEGVLGGVVGVVLLAFFCGTMVWRFQGIALAVWVALATPAGLISVIGDLSESKLKRIAGVKDSGSLLPGHGGVLDRIDALTAAAPIFAWGWLMFFDARS